MSSFWNGSDTSAQLSHGSLCDNCGCAKDNGSPIFQNLLLSIIYVAEVFLSSMSSILTFATCESIHVPTSLVPATSSTSLGAPTPPTSPTSSPSESQSA